MARFTEYQVLGRKLPTEAEPAPKVRPVFLAVLCVPGNVSTDRLPLLSCPLVCFLQLFRMRIFAPNEVVAKSRFWYFLRQLHKVKKASGEIVAVNIVRRFSSLSNGETWAGRKGSQLAGTARAGCRDERRIERMRTKGWQKERGVVYR